MPLLLSQSPRFLACANPARRAEPVHPSSRMSDSGPARTARRPPRGRRPLARTSRCRRPRSVLRTSAVPVRFTPQPSASSTTPPRRRTLSATLRRALGKSRHLRDLPAGTAFSWALPDPQSRRSTASAPPPPPPPNSSTRPPPRDLGLDEKLIRSFGPIDSASAFRSEPSPSVLPSPRSRPISNAPSNSPSSAVLPREIRRPPSHAPRHHSGPHPPWPARAPRPARVQPMNAERHEELAALAALELLRCRAEQTEFAAALRRSPRARHASRVPSFQLG